MLIVVAFGENRSGSKKLLTGWGSCWLRQVGCTQIRTVQSATALKELQREPRFASFGARGNGVKTRIALGCAGAPAPGPPVSSAYAVAPRPSSPQFGLRERAGAAGCRCRRVRGHGHDATSATCKLDATIDALSIVELPYFRSGILFDFPVRRSHGATLRIVLDDGGDIPAGASVELGAGGERFSVALQGMAYVTGLAAQDRLFVTWKGRRCVIAQFKDSSRTEDLLEGQRASYEVPCPMSKELKCP